MGNAAGKCSIEQESITAPIDGTGRDFGHLQAFHLLQAFFQIGIRHGDTTLPSKERVQLAQSPRTPPRPDMGYDRGMVTLQGCLAAPI